MRDLAALKPILYLVAGFAFAMILLSLLVLQGVTKFIVPPPEQTAAGLVKAIGAHRYEGALNQLSQDLRQQINEEELEEIAKEIEQNQQGIEQAHGEDAQEQEDTATASVKVKTGNLQEQTLQFPLVKENGVWRVNSIEPLLQLTN